MKIEKISEIQIKIILDESDLLEHDIKLIEFASGTEKMHSLFQEMMEMAMEQCGFEVKNTPLLVEAIPLALNSIIIIVTKVENQQSLEESFSFAPFARAAGRFRAKDILEVDIPGERRERGGTKTAVYSFAELDGTMDAAARILNIFEGESAVYKYQKRYFMVLACAAGEGKAFDDVEAILAEYGKKHSAGSLSGYYLQDHGEVIVKKDAVRKLATIV